MIPVFLSRLAALSPAVEAAAVAVVAVVTVTQGVDPQDPPTPLHSNEFYLNVHISWIYSGFQNAFDALSVSFATFQNIPDNSSAPNNPSLNAKKWQKILYI